MSDVDDVPRNPTTPKGDQDIIQEAKKRFARCQDWERYARENFKNDLKFYDGDAYNLYQWPDQVMTARYDAKQPTLTINKTRQNCLAIINDAKQNKPSVTIRPVGNEATYEAAQVFEGIIRHIEYISAAEQVYDTATQTMVIGGIGYWRVMTDWVSEESFDQEIKLRRIRDPLSVYLDPDIIEADGSDAKFGIVFEDRPREEVEQEYPQIKKDGGAAQNALGSDQWVMKDTIRIAEYYRKTTKETDKLVAFTTPDGQTIVERKSKLPKEVYEEVKALGEAVGFQERPVSEDRVEWFKIVGEQIVERTTWPGRYIPIVRVVAEELVIDATMDRKGHVRALLDPQRIYNYWSSSAVEQVALQGKQPFVGPVAAFANLENYWGKANLVNLPYLPYNGIDEEGNPVTPPQRQMPPVMAQAYIQGMQVAQQEMMMASGQYQSQMGENENAKSGTAINARQRQGERQTYHYIDALGVAITYTGKILLDLIPKVYDTKRVIMILGEDGDQSQVTIDPQAPQAMQEVKTDTIEDKVSVIFNPNIGMYAVQADVGPGYATKRQEAFNAFTQIVSQNNELVGIVGDIMFKNADFPGAEEIAERLGRMVPPQAKGDAPPPEVQQMQQQLQGLQQVLEQMSAALMEKEQKLQDKSADIDIRQYEAETKRIGEVANAVPEVGIDALKAVIRQTLAEMMGQPQPEGGMMPEMMEQGGDEMAEMQPMGMQ